MRSLEVTLGDGTRLRVAPHAGDRYLEKVRPSLDPAVAPRELWRVLSEHGVLADEPPEWADRDDGEVSEEHLEERAERWVLVGDDVAFPVFGRSMVTCVVCGGVSDAALEHRRARRAAQAERRKAWLGQQGAKRDGAKVGRQRGLRARGLRERER